MPPDLGVLLPVRNAAPHLAVAAFIDPLKAGHRCAELPVLTPEDFPPGRHLLLVAVGPRHLRRHLGERFASEGRALARDYLWLFR